MEDTTDRFKYLVSLCKSTVTLTVNQHRNFYESVTQYFEIRNFAKEVDPDVLEQMVKTDTVIEVDVFPDSPVGHYSIYHYDIDKAIEEAIGAVTIRK